LTAALLGVVEPEGNLELVGVFSLVALLLIPAGFFAGVDRDGRRELVERAAPFVRSHRLRGEDRRQ
jgi:hypothetical protein